MDFKLYLEEVNAQKKIDKLAKLYKNKKIIIYGAGQLSQAIFENYDVSKLNIVAVADKKFEIIEKEKRDFYNYNCIMPFEISEFDCDLILIANLDYNRFLSILDNQILYGFKNASVEIRPFIKIGFWDLFKKKIKEKRLLKGMKNS